jgi:hypothetical protein
MISYLSGDGSPDSLRVYLFGPAADASDVAEEFHLASSLVELPSDEPHAPGAPRLQPAGRDYPVRPADAQARAVILPSAAELPGGLAGAGLDPAGLDPGRGRRRASSAGGIDIADLSSLLLAAGWRDTDDDPARSAGLGGAPGVSDALDVYVCARRVTGLPPGCYGLDRETWSLAGIPPAASSPGFLAGIPADLRQTAMFIVVAAVFHDPRARWGARGYRLCLLEAGRRAQRLVSASEAIGIDARAVFDFVDQVTNDALRLDGVMAATLCMVALDPRRSGPVQDGQGGDPGDAS